MAQLSPYYFGDILDYNSIYALSPFFTNSWIGISLFDNSFEFPNYNNFSFFSYPDSNPLYGLFPETSPISIISPWAGLNDPWGYSINRYNSSTDPYYTLPILYPTFSNLFWMLGSYWNPLNGYYNFLQNNPSSTQVDQDNTSISELINKPWKLQSYGVIGEEKSIIPDSKITIQFDEDNKYEGNAGCNHYLGTYDVSNNSTLSVFPLGGTDAVCFTPPDIMEQEEGYLEALENVSFFKISQNLLKLCYDNKQKVLNFLDKTNWLNAYIAMLEKMPVANPPAKIIQYTWNEEIVYYEPPRCCDIWSSLYDSEGNIICHPDGGLCGYGDGGCPDINSELKDPVIIWEDNR